MTTLPAVVRIIDLPTGTTITGLEVFEAIQTVAGVQISVQVPINQVMTSTLGGLPTGGGTGQILNKSSAANFSTTWSSISSFVSVGNSLATSGSATAIVVSLATNVVVTGILNVGGTSTLTGPVLFGAAATSRVSMGAFGVMRVQTFTASGTYTPNPNMVYCLIEAVGGGAGGGGVGAATAALYGGGGGGGGAYAKLIASTGNVGASQVVTIGVNGTGSVGTATPATAGGSTSVGALCSANGGLPGTAAYASSTGPGGGGGTTGVGDVVVVGGAGLSGGYDSSGNVASPQGGNGGSSLLGAGAQATGIVNGQVGTGITATGYGGGGSGAASKAATTIQSGGNGAKGIVIITEFCTQ